MAKKGRASKAEVHYVVSHYGKNKSTQDIAVDLDRTVKFVEEIVKKHLPTPQVEVTELKEIVVPPVTDKRGITVMTQGSSESADKQRESFKGSMFRDEFIYRPKK